MPAVQSHTRLCQLCSHKHVCAGPAKGNHKHVCAGPAICNHKHVGASVAVLVGLLQAVCHRAVAHDTVGEGSVGRLHGGRLHGGRLHGGRLHGGRLHRGRFAVRLAVEVSEHDEEEEGVGADPVADSRRVAAVAHEEEL